MTYDWNRQQTADDLAINRTTLYKKMRQLGIDPERLDINMDLSELTTMFNIQDALDAPETEGSE